MRLREGTSFRGKLGIAVLKAVSNFDAAAVLRAKARMSSTARTLLTERYVASDWYPVEGIEEVIRVLAEELNEKPEALAHRLGRGVGFSGAGTVGRAFLSVFGTPTRFEKYLPATWRQLYDSGIMRARFDPLDNVLCARVYGWKGHSPLHCFAPLGAVEELAHRMRSPELQSASRVECVSLGAERCTYELRFERGDQKTASFWEPGSS
jgi:hypothetical protein